MFLWIPSRCLLQYSEVDYFWADEVDFWYVCNLRIYAWREGNCSILTKNTHTHKTSTRLLTPHTHTRQAHDYSEFFGIRDYNGFTMTTQIIFTIFINSIYAKRKAQLQYRLVSVWFKAALLSAAPDSAQPFKPPLPDGLHGFKLMTEEVIMYREEISTSEQLRYSA